MKIYLGLLLAATIVALGNAKTLGFRRTRSNGTEEVLLKSDAQPIERFLLWNGGTTEDIARTSPPVVRPSPTPLPASGPDGYNPNIALRKNDYKIIDSYRRNRIITYFDPEIWVEVNPTYPFPTELDIPFQWSIYNPVTVQAPRPTAAFDLQSVKYSGFYYACPNYVNPYKYSWFYKNEQVNPCKWIWYQTQADNAPIYLL